jgi:FKBP-type peptidyl-prolyl cis-trans isomerase SlyD
MADRVEILKDTVVKLDFTVTDDEGMVLDSSDNEGPLVYLHGGGTMIPGVEEQLEGKHSGESHTFTVSPDQAFGMHDPGKVASFPRKDFDFDIQPGQMLQGQTEDGRDIVFQVMAVGDKVVTLDANHPWVGKNLNFDVKILEVRPATQEEVEHGHPHGPGDGHE